jgi:hypothetical protein
LPPDVSYEKQRLSDAWAYVFRHRVLGELGRILLQELADGSCHISCEVVGNPSDPMTMQRTAIFQPLGLELTRQMEAAFARTPEDTRPFDPPPRPPEAKEVIESKIIPCERCRDTARRLAALDAKSAGLGRIRFGGLHKCYDGQNERFIPEPLRGHTRHLLNSETNYTKLYAFLTGQAGVTPGELGSLKTLAPACADDLGKGLNELIAEPERCR